MPAAAARAREGAGAGGAGARAQRAWGVRPGPLGPAPWRYRELARRARGRRVGTGQLFPGPSALRERAKAPGLLTCRGAGVGGGAGASVRFARDVERVPHGAPSASAEPRGSEPQPPRNRATLEEQLLRSLEGSRPPWHWDGGDALCSRRPLLLRARRDAIWSRPLAPGCLFAQDGVCDLAIPRQQPKPRWARSLRGL